MDEHGIAKGEKAIFFLYGNLICSHGFLIPVKRRDQHNQSAFRQVEVCHQAVNSVQLYTGVQENIGSTAARDNLAVLGPDGFQRAAAGGTDSNYAMAAGACCVDGLGCSIIHAVPFGVHLVLLNIILVDRAEGAKANVQGHFHNVDPLGTDGIQQFRGKMQPGCGGSRAAKFFGVYGLVLALIL